MYHKVSPEIDHVRGMFREHFEQNRKNKNCANFSVFLAYNKICRNMLKSEEAFIE